MFECCKSLYQWFVKTDQAWKFLRVRLMTIVQYFAKNFLKAQKKCGERIRKMCLNISVLFLICCWPFSVQSDDKHLRSPDHKIGPGVSQEAERILEDLVSLRPLHHSAPTGLQSHCLLSQDCYSLIELLSFEGRKSFKIFFYFCFSE